MSANHSHLDRINKIFVGGLKVDCTPLEVSMFFSKYGQVYDVQLKYKKKQKDLCLGYGIVTMDPQVCKTLISREFLEFEGRKIRCSPYLKGEQLNAYIKHLNARRILLDGVPENFPEEILNQYFSQFGEVENCYSIERYGKNLSAGKGFVIFKDARSSKKVLEIKTHIVNGIPIVCQLLRNDKQQNQQRKKNNQNRVLNPSQNQIPFLSNQFYMPNNDTKVAKNKEKVMRNRQERGKGKNQFCGFIANSDYRYQGQIPLLFGQEKKVQNKQDNHNFVTRSGYETNFNQRKAPQFNKSKSDPFFSLPTSKSYFSNQRYRNLCYRHTKKNLKFNKIQNQKKPLYYQYQNSYNPSAQLYTKIPETFPYPQQCYANDSSKNTAHSSSPGQSHPSNHFGYTQFAFKKY